MKVQVKVLNLIINGIPSIRKYIRIKLDSDFSFKPYYKWNTFNTLKSLTKDFNFKVLNLIINGIPSILSLGAKRC